MTRIFISHSHSDEAIADLLIDFLGEAMEISKKDIRCTSDPNHGLDFSSKDINEQLKNDLKNAGALIVIATLDSLRSPWILFEVGSFWTTDKVVAPIVGPGLKFEDLPGPLKGYRSIAIEKEDVEFELNELVNQLTNKLNLKQFGVTRRRANKLKAFIRDLRAWQSKLPEQNLLQQKEIAELTEKLQKSEEIIQQLEEKVRSYKKQLEVKGQYQNQTKTFTEDLGNGIKLEMIAIPGGKFLMGTEDEKIERLVKKYDWDGFRREKPQHEVTVQSFYMGIYPVTQAQYQQIMGKSPSRFKGNNRPVDRVSWDDAVEFCQKLSQNTGQEYRLPTEAEWEYACRAGTTTAYYFGDTITEKLANYGSLFGGETTPVGKYKPNSFGLYDMHGNVWEWCQDDWHENYKNAPDNSKAWGLGKSIRKVMRGGSWYSYPYGCRSAYSRHGTRDTRSDSIGFRVVCALIS